MKKTQTTLHFSDEAKGKLKEYAAATRVTMSEALSTLLEAMPVQDMTKIYLAHLQKELEQKEV